MPSIIDMLSGSLDSNAVAAIGKQLGQDSGATSTAISAALPMLVGAFSRSADQDGAAGLGRALDKKHDGSILDDVAGYLSKNDQSDGTGILGHVLGSKQNAASQMLGAASGLGKDQASSLLATLAPMVMGALGKARRDESLGDNNLQDMLSGAARSEAKRAPGMMGALSGLLDADGDGDTDLQDVLKHGVGKLGGLFK